ncbi:MAG: Glycosyl transferase group 1 [candidate division WS6 bacterium GW2011_GWF2_39_15]|uniref:Glycosyl transferase group 1 n=1 Tax=candidate division WS6 bacterium GW2011_GWF2_39_15 TaxID=1619100 RepID=A0A0G0N0D7_9BACT|nr:MAG: Glycosyl transferase group 1 [candidate division WS6 bacterium GW2011_GWF2_39_15]
MKILLAVPEYPPHHIGGGGEVYKQLATNYQRLGHEVTVLYGYYPNRGLNSKIKSYKKDNIIFYEVPELPYPKSKPFLRTAMPATMKAKKELQDIISSDIFDVAHLHGYGWPLINTIAGLCMKFNIPYIYTLHGYPESQNSSPILRLIWNNFILPTQNRSLSQAHSLTAISDYVAKDPRNTQLSKTHTIFNGINYSSFREIANEVDIKTENNISDDDLFIYSIGRLAEMKGFQNIVKLIPQINKQGMKVKYLIAGDDDGYMKELEKLVSNLRLEDQVKLVGFHGDDTKKMFIKQCNIYAVPSLWEPFGLTVLEGMVFEKLILTTEAGGIKEVLEGYSNKINMDDKDLINKIISRKQNRSEMDWNRFNWETISKNYLSLLEEAAIHTKRLA